jgi:hypothetical protein
VNNSLTTHIYLEITSLLGILYSATSRPKHLSIYLASTTRSEISAYRKLQQSSSPAHQSTMATIPQQLSPEEKQVYQTILSASRDHVPSVLVTSDLGKDYDDLAALVLLGELDRLGLIKFIGLVANLYPAEERAQFARGALNSLGLENVPVAIGTRATTKDIAVKNYEFNTSDGKPVSFMGKETNFKTGVELYFELYRKAEKSKQKITLLFISSLQDITEFVEGSTVLPNGTTVSHKKLFIENTEKVILQGGYVYYSGVLTPQTNAANNAFNLEAAEKFHKLLGQQKDIPSVVYEKTAAFGAAVPVKITQDFADTKHPLGLHLHFVQEEQDLHFYKTASGPPGQIMFGWTDKAWFLQNRCSWADEHKDNEKLAREGPEDPRDVLPYCSFIMYDALAALGTLDGPVLDKLGVLTTPVAWGNRRVVGVSKPPALKDGEQKPAVPRPGDLLPLGTGIDKDKMITTLRAFIKGSLYSAVAKGYHLNHDGGRKLGHN